MTGRLRLCALMLLAATLTVAETGKVGGTHNTESCTISASSLAFGTYDPLAAGPLDSTGSVSTNCTSGRPPHVDYDVHLDSGQSSSYAPRRMSNGSSNLNYNLYTDIGRTTVWGDGTGGTGTVGISFNVTRPGSSQTTDHTVYGRIFAGQTVSTGSYSDSLVITIVF